MEPAVPDFSTAEVSAFELTVIATPLLATEFVSFAEPPTLFVVLAFVFCSEVSLFLTTDLANLAVLLD